jgi:transcriptional regulator with XRE-family HTH domain
MTSQVAQQANAAVGARINALMWAKRVTQRQLAAALGVNQSGVSARLRGRTALTVGELFVVAALLDVDPVDLVNENGPATLAVSVPARTALPRLDSNQQPSGYASPQVSGGVLADVVDLASRRERAAVAS